VRAKPGASPNPQASDPAAQELDIVPKSQMHWERRYWSMAKRCPRPPAMRTTSHGRYTVAPFGKDPVVATTDLPMTPMVAERGSATRLVRKDCGIRLVVSRTEPIRDSES
jgi:hypothetical protein